MHDPWVNRDPLLRMQRYLKAKGVVDASGLEKIEEDVREELRIAWDEAQNEPAPDAREYFEHVHAQPSDRLKRQLSRLSKDGDA
jgi:pyruvate dehydrogenase E1 component alpha subunit